MKKFRVVAIVSVCIVFIAAGLAYLWYLQRLRNDMETHLAQAIEHVESGKNESALSEANVAHELALRLDDDHYVALVGDLIAVIEYMMAGLEYFELGDFQAAQEEFILAQNFARNIENLDSSFIGEIIELNDQFIYFEEMVAYGEMLLEHGDYDDALLIFENAKSLADSLDFDEGAAIVAGLIEETEQRIIQAKRVIAVEYEGRGEFYYENKLFQNALESYQSALEIYREIGDSESILRMFAAISKTAQSHLAYIEEQLRLENEQLEAERLEAKRLEAELAEALLAEMEQAEQQGQGGANANHLHNRSIYFDLETPIDNQRLPPATLIQMGSRHGMNEGWYNGCGWIAAYNALIALGEPAHPAEIVYHFETNRGTVLDGVLGTFPHAIERFLRDSGFDVNHTLFPRGSLDIDEVIGSSRVAILAYTHTSAAHFITIVYEPSESVFIVFNDSLARRRSAALRLNEITEVGAAIDSVNAFLRETPEILFSFSLITVE
jgi:tetratricopeptide (TPR) repeat protein